MDASVLKYIIFGSIGLLVIAGIAYFALAKQMGKSEDLITYVNDRPGHDLRYAIDSTKVEKEGKTQAEAQTHRPL